MFQLLVLLFIIKLYACSNIFKEKIMSEMHLRKPRFTCSTCGPFTKKQRKNTKNSRKRRFLIYLSKGTR